MAEGIVRDKGPCIVDYDGSALGPYFESVSFRTSSTGSDVFESAQGTTPVDRIVTGYGETTVTVPFTRDTLANLALVIPGASVSTSGLKTIPKNEVGRSEYERSKVLILQPIVDGVKDADTKHWLYMDHAYPSDDIELLFDGDNQRVFNVVFHCFPDATTGIVWHTNT